MFIDTFFPNPTEHAISLISECEGNLGEALMLADYRLDEGTTDREVKWWFNVRLNLMVDEDENRWN